MAFMPPFTSRWCTTTATTFKPEAQLAISWREMSPTQMRFVLRPGVKFSDGSPLTADDVVYSIMRAMAKTSNYAVYTQGIDKAVKVNDTTVDLIMKGPNPVLLNQLTELRIMSKAWAEKNKSVEPKDIRTKDESFAHRNAMGTGPFMVKEWQPDQKLVLVKNPQWYWGQRQDQCHRDHLHARSSRKPRAWRRCCRRGGLRAGPEPAGSGPMRANANLKVIDGVENRTIFFGMDQHRDELPGSNIKGKNPLKDQRVRMALYQASTSHASTG
jgi:peptide/nickel transport system substrate-binding protein